MVMIQEDVYQSSRLGFCRIPTRLAHGPPTPTPAPEGMRGPPTPALGRKIRCFWRKYSDGEEETGTQAEFEGQREV